jgi:hypothetical protein
VLRLVFVFRLLALRSLVLLLMLGPGFGRGTRSLRSGFGLRPGLRLRRARCGFACRLCCDRSSFVLRRTRARRTRIRRWLQYMTWLLRIRARRCLWATTLAGRRCRRPTWNGGLRVRSALGLRRTRNRAGRVCRGLRYMAWRRRIRVRRRLWTASLTRLWGRRPGRPCSIGVRSALDLRRTRNRAGGVLRRCRRRRVRPVRGRRRIRG